MLGISYKENIKRSTNEVQKKASPRPSLRYRFVPPPVVARSSLRSERQLS